MQGAAPKLVMTSVVKPGLASAKAPLGPKAMRKLSDRHREICGDVFKFNLS
jgi:hypothetical protein